MFLIDDYRPADSRKKTRAAQGPYRRSGVGVREVRSATPRKKWRKAGWAEGLKARHKPRGFTSGLQSCIVLRPLPVHYSQVWPVFNHTTKVSTVSAGPLHRKNPPSISTTSTYQVFRHPLSFGGFLAFCPSVFVFLSGICYGFVLWFCESIIHTV